MDSVKLKNQFHKEVIKNWSLRMIHKLKKKLKNLKNNMNRIYKILLISSLTIAIAII